MKLNELTTGGFKECADLDPEPPSTVEVRKYPKKLGVATLCRLMDDCLPEQIEDERDMQRLIDKLWPALVCEFESET